MDIPLPSTVLKHPSVINGHQDTFLAPKYRDKIDDNFDKLFDVDLKIILPKLREKRVITFEHYDDLWEKVHKGQERQAKSDFLHILPTRGRKAFLWFCHILLVKAEQEFLYDLLVDDEAKDAIGDLLQSESRDEDFIVPGTEDVRAFLEAERRNITPMLHDRTQTVPKCVDPPTELLYSQGADSHTTGDSNVTAGGVARGSVLLAPAADDRELISAVQPSSDAAGEDMVEADHPEDDREFDRPDPDWIKELRGYQRELAEPGLQGHNYIICSPTGSGKTRVAACVVYNHLKRTRDRGRAVFFAPTVALVRQQHEEFKRWFSALKVDYLVGPELEEKAEIDVMLKKNHVTLMTPAIFENALIEGKVKGLHQVTLMIFDECHHTHSENIYNKIMGRYVDNKIKLQRGDLDISPRLPQVIGITASLGVGDARGNDSAVYFVLKKCANLDARQIAVVKRNKEELAKYVHEPTEEMAMIPGRQNDPFARTIFGAMKEIEEKIREIPGTENVAPSDLEFPDKKDSQVYLSYLSTIMWKIAKLPTGSYTRRRIISCLEYLACYHKALTLHDEVRAKDALNLLQRMLDLRGPTVKEDDPTEMWLKEMYSEKWQILTTLSENDRNPKLVALKQMILKAYDEQPDTHAILFTRTKNATEALKSWVNEDPDMSHIGALRITGTSSEDTAGMTSKNQQDVVKHFKKGVCRLLIATSVAEEGLDIKACNCVFRYNYTTNEIGRVQSKGRARKEKSSYHTITSADQQHLEDREKMNLYKEGLMRYAVGMISEMDREDYENQIFELQKMDYMDRRLKEFLLAQKQARKSTDEFLVCCFKCDEVVCLSKHIVLFGENRYTCIEPGFDESILVKPHAKPKKIPMMQQLHKVVCKKCKCYWGTIVKYKGKVQLPLLQSSGFTYFTRLEGGWIGDRVCGPAVKKWDDAPCVFERVPEDKVYKHFRGKSYDPVYYERRDLDPELN